MRIVKQLLLIIGFTLYMSMAHHHTVYGSEDQSFFKRVEGRIGHSPNPEHAASESNKKELLVVDTSPFVQRKAHLPETGAKIERQMMYLGILMIAISLSILFSNKNKHRSVDQVK